MFGRVHTQPAPLLHASPCSARLRCKCTATVGCFLASLQLKAQLNAHVRLFPDRLLASGSQVGGAAKWGGGWGGGWWVGGVWGWGVGGGVQPGGESRGSARVGGSGTLPRLLNTADGNHATYQTGRACFSPPPCPIPFVSAQSLTDIFYGGGQHEARRGGAGGERTRVPHAAARTCADGGEASEALSGSRRCKRGRPG